jgi:hypothetical protein
MADRKGQEEHTHDPAPLYTLRIVDIERKSLTVAWACGSGSSYQDSGHEVTELQQQEWL